MRFSINRQFILKRYARLVLALFVMSVINMAVQLPVHAAMMSKMQQSMASSQMPADVMPGMSQKTMQCECPTAVCEGIVSLNDQNNQNQFSVSFNYLLSFQPVYSSYIEDAHHRTSAIRLNYHEWQYRQNNPPPLSITSILHI